MSCLRGSTTQILIRMRTSHVFQTIRFEAEKKWMSNVDSFNIQFKTHTKSHIRNSIFSNAKLFISSSYSSLSDEWLMAAELWVTAYSLVFEIRIDRTLLIHLISFEPNHQTSGKCLTIDFCFVWINQSLSNSSFSYHEWLSLFIPIPHLECI